MNKIAMFGMFVLSLVVLIEITSSTTVNTCGISQGKLIFSHILYRHGDRTPEAFYPTDPYCHSYDWPVGPGQLTNTGKTQHYRFGQWLRRRYDADFLPAHYSAKIIYVRSTDYDRTIASALCNLAGLYPPTGDEVWNTTIRWQPIPVHSVPAANDWLLGATPPSCLVYDQEMTKVISSPDVQMVMQEYHSQINYVLENAGMSLNQSLAETLQNILLIRDTLFIEKLYKKRLPAWTESVYPSEWLDRISLLFYILPAYTPQLAKFRIGYFFKDILDRSMSKVNGRLSPDLSLYVYSAHDINISSVLQGLGMWDNRFVQYAASLLFEIRIRKNVPYMEIFYKRSADTKTLELLYIPKCGYACPLQKLYTLYDNILPKNDIQTECNLKTH